MSVNKLLSYDTLVHALSGAAGGVTAMSIFFPLDTIRSRLQVEDCRVARNTFLMLKDLAEDEGLESLYRGIQPVLISLCCSNFVYFYTFHGLRSVIVSQSRGYNAVRDLAMASIAGVINVFVTTPLWVANSRLKMQGVKLCGDDNKQLTKYPLYSGLFDVISKIWKTEGWQNLWSSLIPSLMLVSNPAIQFTVYESLKLEALKLLQTKDLNAAMIFALGAISKCISTFATYPLQLVQMKLRYGDDNLKKMNVLQVFIFIIRLHGIRGLYKGLEAKLLQTVFTAALMFLCYEKIAGLVFHVMRVSKKPQIRLC